MPRNQLKILAVDPGYAITGWAIVEKKQSQLVLLAYGAITTNKNMPHAERLKVLSLKLKEIIKRHKPNTLAIEELFFFKNLKTALKVAEARGVILLSAIEQNLEIKEYTPLQIKQALVGYGRAEKKQIQHMVKIIFQLKTIPEPDDIADAMAIAVTCAHSL